MPRGPTLDHCKANKEPYSTLFCINDIYLDTLFMGPEPSSRWFLLHFVKSELEAGRCHPRDDHMGSGPSMRVSEHRDPVQLHGLHAGQQAGLGAPPLCHL